MTTTDEKRLPAEMPLKMLRENLEKCAHVYEGEGMAIRDSLKLKELLLSFVKLSDAEREVVRQYFVWERTLAMTFLEQSKSARDLKERFDELVAKETAEAPR